MLIFLPHQNLIFDVQENKFSIVHYCVGNGAFETLQFLEEKGADLKANYDFWIARYYAGYKEMSFSKNPATAYVPNLPEINLIGWQYTSSGKVDGYNGSLDLDVLYSPIKNSSDKQRIAVLKEGTKGLNIRSTDSTSGNILGTYGPEDKIIITGRSSNTGWYLTPRGWISDKYVTIIS